MTTFKPDFVETGADGLKKEWLNGVVVAVTARDGIRCWTREGLAYLWCVTPRSVSNYYEKGLPSTYQGRYSVTPCEVAKKWKYEKNLKKNSIRGKKRAEALARNTEKSFERLYSPRGEL